MNPEICLTFSFIASQKPGEAGTFQYNDAILSTQEFLF